MSETILSGDEKVNRILRKIFNQVGIQFMYFIRAVTKVFETFSNKRNDYERMRFKWKKLKHYCLTECAVQHTYKTEKKTQSEKFQEKFNLRQIITTIPQHRSAR